MHYFAYGCNMDPHVMDGRLAKGSRRVLAWIHGYRLVFDIPSHTDSHIGFANIICDPKGVVYGILYTDVTHKGLKELDVQEEYPELYQRATMAVETEQGKVKAVVYVGNKKIIKPHLKPSPHYLLCILHGKDLLPGRPLSVLKHFALQKRRK